MQMRVVNLEEKARLIKERHKYKLIAELNDYQFKLVKAKREFIWHSHEETDEMFFIVEGQMKLATREKVFELEKGELIVVPKGVEHKPVSENEAHILVFEPKSTKHTGDVESENTVKKFDWI